MEKYVQIYSLDEAMENEKVCALYPRPSQNVSGRKYEETMVKAEQDAKEGKCELLVWRKIVDEDFSSDFTISKNDVNNIIIKYHNAKRALEELQKAGNPECRFELGRALALEYVLSLLGYKYEEIRRQYWCEDRT